MRNGHQRSIHTPHRKAMTACFQSTGLGNSQRSGFSGMMSCRLQSNNITTCAGGSPRGGLFQRAVLTADTDKLRIARFCVLFARVSCMSRQTRDLFMFWAVIANQLDERWRRCISLSLYFCFVFGF